MCKFIMANSLRCQKYTYDDLPILRRGSLIMYYSSLTPDNKIRT